MFETQTAVCDRTALPPVRTEARTDPLMENWKRVFSKAEKPSWRRVRVLDGVANVVAKDIHIRCEMPKMADGFYAISATGDLTAVPPSGRLDYPDPESARPDMKEIKSCGKPIKQHEVIQLINFVEQVRRSDRFDSGGAEVCFDAKGIFARYDSKLTLDCNADLPFSGEGVAANAELVKLALTECLRYEHIFIAHENNPDKNNPILFGISWEKCVLVWPTFNSRKI